MKADGKKQHKGLLSAGWVANKKTKRTSDLNKKNAIWARTGLKKILQKGGL